MIASGISFLHSSAWRVAAMAILGFSTLLTNVLGIVPAAYWIAYPVSVT
jgi:hypothetical protein